MAQCMPCAGKFSIVTGASGGIGLELAKCCAQDGYDLLIAADEPRLAKQHSKDAAPGTAQH